MSVTNIVDYVLNMKGNLEPGLDSANSHAKKLESSLGGVKGMLGSIAGLLGAGMIAYKAFEFVKEGITDYGNLKIAQDQVKAGLESTGHAAGIAYEEIERISNGLFNASNFTKDQVMDMQSIIVTFPGITKKSFGEAGQIVTDMAQRMHQDLKQTAIQVGKALQDPVLGATALRRVGVNLSKEQTEAIKNLVAEGKKSEAQQMVMTELQNEFAGSAKAAYDSLPLSHFNKQMEEVKESIGQGIVELETVLEPVFFVLGETIMTIVEGFKIFYSVIKDNWQTIKDTITVISAVSAALLLQAAYANASAIGFWALELAANALTIAGTALTAVTWLFSAALWSTGIPEIIIAVAALTAGIIALSRHFGSFGNAVSGVWDIIKAFGKGVGGVFFGIGEMVAGIFNPSLMAKGLSDVINSVKTAGIDIKNAWNNADATSAYFGSGDKSLLPKTKAGKTGPTGASGETIAAPKTKAEGQKVINIHVAYNAPLISGFTISTTNIKEGLGSLKEQVSAILVGATHDSLMVADN